MNLDIPRLIHDIHDLDDRSRAIKLRVRRRWEQPMGALQAELLELAADATELYTLRAWSRGRLHRQRPPRSLSDAHRDLGLPLDWDAQQHNRSSAERIAERYRVPPAEHESTAEHAATASSVAV